MVSRKEGSVGAAVGEVLAAEVDRAKAGGVDAGVLRGVHLNVRAELGRKVVRLEEALALRAGSLVELDARPDDPVGLWVDDLLVARGVVVVVDDRFCIRVTEVLPAGAGKEGER